ncbi:MAG TPA: acid phosphatase [Usitatibacter sp.]|nr:acid phosphatase [Usitatibacter sp.]
MTLRPLIVSLAAVLAAACVTTPAGNPKLAGIDTIVVIYAENHSFDNMYGMFPGADGVANATAEQKTQLDHDGNPLPHLPPVYVSGKPDPKYPAQMPNGPFRIDGPPVNASIDQIVPSPIHNYYHNIEQINGGKNNMFVAVSTAGSWVMGYYDGSSQKMWKWAQRYTLADRFFMGAFGGSFLNHQWLICACTPVFADAPASTRAQLDENGKLKRRATSPKSVLEGPVQVFDGAISPDGYAVNTAQPAYQPSGVAPAPNGNLDLADPAKHPIPPQTARTIGDTLSARGISWAWYGGAYNEALADGRRAPDAKRAVIYNREGASPNFQPHHQPFNYYSRFAPGTPDRARHLKDGADFVAAIEKGTLPQVSFYKPAGKLNQHPSYTDIQSGDIHIAELLEKIEKSPQWPRILVIVTYDENGGYWDHVPPPSGPGWGDRWGPATRVPTIIVGPTVKRGHVDHTSYDTTSILKLITKRFNLEPLPGVREKTGDLTNALN